MTYTGYPKGFRVLSGVANSLKRLPAVLGLPEPKDEIDLVRSYRERLSDTFQEIQARVRAIREKTSEHESVAFFLAPAPDREGELIAWHLQRELQALGPPAATMHGFGPLAPNRLLTPGQVAGCCWSCTYIQPMKIGRARSTSVITHCPRLQPQRSRDAPTGAGGDPPP